MVNDVTGDLSAMPESVSGGHQVSAVSIETEAVAFHLRDGVVSLEMNKHPLMHVAHMLARSCN